MKAKQLRNGNQAKQYANHVYEWIVTSEDNETKEEILEWCKNNLKDAPKNRSEYLAYKRQHNSFHEEMKAICNGFYDLVDNRDNTYTYTVEYEYID